MGTSGRVSFEAPLHYSGTKATNLMRCVFPSNDRIGTNLSTTADSSHSIPHRPLVHELLAKKSCTG